MSKRIGDGLERYWALLALIAFCAAIASCAQSRIVSDPVTGEQTIEVVGQDILPGGGEITQDVAGAVVDAVEQVDPGEIIEKVAGRDWWGLGGILAGIVSLVAGGFFARRRIRSKKASAVQK